jgi:hypothetical protein
MRKILMGFIVALMTMVGLAGPAHATVSGSASGTIKVKIKWDYIVQQDGVAKSEIAHSSACFWDNGGGTNTGTINGVYQTWIEDSPVHWCPLKHSVTINGTTFHWAKVGGGESGSHCGNPGIPGGGHQPKPTIPRGSLVLDVKNLAKFWLKFKEKIDLSVSGGEYHPCPDGGFVTGNFSASAHVTGRTKIQISAMMSLLVKNGGNVKATLKEHLKLFYMEKLTADVNGQITAACGGGTPPPPPAPTYSCNTLSVAQSGPHMVTITGFSTSQANGATFKNAVINWGDGQSSTYTAPVGKTHTYGADGTYTIQATAVFDVNGQQVQATSGGCMAAVTFNTPPPPDTPPSMTCQGPQHIFVGDDAMDADFDLTDVNGDPVSYGAPAVSGPISITVVDDNPITGGVHRAIGIVAQNTVPSGQQQTATLSETGYANGKSTSCTVTITVVNAG